MQEYFYPDYKITIGNKTFNEAIKLEAQLDKKLSFDWSEILFTRNLKNISGISKGDEVSIEIGYNGSLEKVFTGYVVDFQDNKVIAKNELIKLSKTVITNTFVNCVPQEAIMFILQQAGINQFKLDSTPYPIKKLLPITKMNGINALKNIHAAFNITNPTVIFKCKKLEWNLDSTQNQIYNFVQAENIISLESIAPHVWEVLTIAVPFIHVMDKISIQHQHVSGEFSVQKIRLQIDENGFIRTRLTFNDAE